MSLAGYVLLSLGSLFVIIDPLAMRIATRLMGLLLTAIAIQFFLDALQALQVIPA